MMAEIECTHPARITGKDGRLVCLTCGKIAVPEKQGRVEPKEWARSALFNYFLILAAGGILGFIAKAASNLSD